jgi:hypothetical protein
VAAQERNDDTVAFGRKQGGDVDEAVDVIRPPVQENNRWAVRWAGLGVTDIENAGVDLLQRRKGCVGARFDRT